MIRMIPDDRNAIADPVERQRMLKIDRLGVARGAEIAGQVELAMALGFAPETPEHVLWSRIDAIPDIEEDTPPPIPVVPMDPNLTAASLSRSRRWHGTINDWSLEDWLCAIGGELGEAMEAALRRGDGYDADDAPRSVWLCAIGAHLGEAMNLSKKLRRVEDNLASKDSAGDDDDFEEGELAQQIGAHIVEMQTIASRFIGSLGFVPRFPLNRMPPQRRLDASVGEELADVLLYFPMALASAGVLDRFNAEVVKKFNAVSERYGFPERMAVR